MHKIGIPWLLALLLLLGGCSSGTYYDQPAGTVRERLGSSQMYIAMFGSQVRDVEVSQSGADKVVWTLIALGDTPALRLTARVVPDNQGSRVSVDVLPPEGTFKERVTKGLQDNPSVVRFYRAIVAEHVDATLRRRAFDMARVYPEMMLAMFASMPKLNKQFDEAAKASRRADANRPSAWDETSGKALPDQDGSWSTSRKYGDPMDDTTPYEPSSY
jgi:hypothetical protein